MSVPHPAPVALAPWRRRGCCWLLSGYVALACQSREEPPPNLLEAPASALGAADAPTEGAGTGLLGGEDQPLKMQELGKARNFTLRVLDVKPCNVEDHFKPQPGRLILGVLIEIEAIGSRSVPANVFYATLEDDTGDEYASTLAGCQPTLEAELLERGKQAKGYVSFNVPDTKRDFVFRYAPQLIGPGTEALRFSIRR